MYLGPERISLDKYKNYSFDHKILNPETGENSMVNQHHEEKNELLNTFNIECEEIVSEKSNEKESTEKAPREPQVKRRIS